MMLLIFTSGSNALIASEVPGFTEPYQTIDVAAGDAVLVNEVHVKAGETIVEGGLLATLDHRALSATLKIADTARKARGRLQSAQSDLELKTKRVEIITQLLERGSANQRELDDARIQQAIAEANVLIVEEDLQLRELEYVRTQQQIEQRHIRSSISGVVVEVKKNPGEFVSPNDPVIATVVQLDPLLAVFSIGSTQAQGLATGQEFQVRVGEGQIVDGILEFLSPVTDPQSHSVEIKIALPNPDGNLKSGEPCTITLEGATSIQQAESKKKQGPPKRSAMRPIFETR